MYHFNFSILLSLKARKASYDLKKVEEMLDYYAKKGCEVKPLSEYMN